MWRLKSEALEGALAIAQAETRDAKQSWLTIREERDKEMDLRREKQRQRILFFPLWVDKQQ